MPLVLESLIQKYLNIYDVYGPMVSVNAQFYEEIKKQVSDDNCDDNTNWELRNLTLKSSKIILENGRTKVL